MRDAIAVLWRARRSYDHRFAFADALGPSHTKTNKEAMPLGTHLIVSRSDDPDFHGVAFFAPQLSSRPPRSSDLVRKRSGRLDGDRWLVTAFACNYSNFSGRTKIRRKYFMVII